ncbi:MAG TPA: Lrp/AsnC ligand binding domain-containing protein [Anaeromyxobacter sp.]|nr:Lrp/AsnC ligand binding domain-containing protein [Anaeromyxobacter sp.]
MRIICKDLAAYQRLYDEKLATLRGVQRLTSTLVMKEVVPERLLLDQRPRR